MQSTVVFSGNILEVPFARSKKVGETRPYEGFDNFALKMTKISPKMTKKWPKFILLAKVGLCRWGVGFRV